MDKLREKREYQDGIKKDIDILNQQAEIVKERKIQEEKELAKKINAFVEQRDAREAALKSEKEYIRKYKEEKQMRLLRLQESQNVSENLFSSFQPIFRTTRPSKTQSVRSTNAKLPTASGEQRSSRRKRRTKRP